MFLRDTQLGSCKWCTSGARQARFTDMSVPGTHGKEQQPQLAPQNLGFERLEVFQWFMEGCQHLIPDLLRCDYIFIQRKRLWSHWSFVRLFFPSFALLPLRLSHWFITRGATPGSLQTMLLSQQSVLQRAASETQLPWIRCIFCTARILTWKEVYPKKRTLEICPGLVKFMVWFCSTRWESLLWTVLLH